jgi:hypothetical protein
MSGEIDARRDGREIKGGTTLMEEWRSRSKSYGRIQD